MGPSRSKSGSTSADSPEDQAVPVDVLTSGLDDALRSVERIEEAARASKGKGKPVVYELDADEGAEGDLDALLQLLEESGAEGPTPRSGGPSGGGEDLSALVDLLDAAAAEAEKAVRPPRRKKSAPGPAVPTAEDVEGGDEIIARLLARERAAQPAAEGPSAANGDSFAEPEPRRPSPAPTPPGQELLEIKEKQLQEVMERFARLQADFENYKKRVDREREEGRKFANEQLLLQILPIVDSFERAINHARQQNEPRAFEDGILLIYKQFRDVLFNIGLRPVESVGRKFDPRFHEAVVQIEDATVEPNTVTSEYQRGYLLSERLLRPARVIVSKGGAAAGATGAPTGAGPGPRGSEED